MNIGFIGVGIMGRGMVRNLMKAGHQVFIYARHPEKAADIVSEGAVLCPSIAACAAGREAVITIVGYPADVEQVYLAPGGVFVSADPGTLCIDMTTSSPTLAQKLYAAGKEKGLRVLDAPVTGGEKGAANGTLSILVGGDKADFEAALPAFEAMGRLVNYQGVAGCGQHAKLANQIIIAGTLSGVCEGLAYAREKGLDPGVLLASVSAGAAGSRQLDNLGQKMQEGDFSPSFFMKHFIKDMALAAEEAAGSGLTLEVLSQTLANCRALAEQGCGEEGTQALYKHYNSLQ